MPQKRMSSCTSYGIGSRLGIVVRASDEVAFVAAYAFAVDIEEASMRLHLLTGKLGRTLVRGGPVSEEIDNLFRVSRDSPDDRGGIHLSAMPDRQ